MTDDAILVGLSKAIVADFFTEKVKFAHLRSLKGIEILAIYCCTVLFKTVKHEYHNRSMSMSEAEFFELINMTYGEKRILLYVFRLAELTLGTHTTVLLETPEEFSQDHIDTVKWKIDKTYIAANSYMQAMIGRALHSDSVQMFVGNLVHVLLSHLLERGSLMDITVVEYDEQMFSMAKKWFGLELSERHQVKVDDGMKFVAKEAERGSTYDIIFLDACSGGILYTDTLCPVSGFLDKRILEDIARLVGPHGILIINALSMKLRGDELEKFLMSKLLEIFEFCTTQRPSASANQVLCWVIGMTVDCGGVLKRIGPELDINLNHPSYWAQGVILTGFRFKPRGIQPETLPVERSSQIRNMSGPPDN
ncbi:unnamed protein product [Haemonchus placei]|uniref:PABS domain-containing protein n=1 Tax=Haemonchus placei TaxID=6290 RepID=A0A158QLU2_HAEPC|nr:unnamed protein product [Haemonchus placei]